MRLLDVHKSGFERIEASLEEDPVNLCLVEAGYGVWSAERMEESIILGEQLYTETQRRRMKWRFGMSPISYTSMLTTVLRMIFALSPCRPAKEI